MSLNGEIYFDMTRNAHRLYGQSKFMLKRWRRYDIFTKTGSFVRSENPRENTYASTSVYLYDYVVVNDTWFFDNVVTASYVSSIPSADSDYAGGNMWRHTINTWTNSPNASSNNYILRPNPPATSFAGHQVSGSLPGYFPNPVPTPFNGLTTDQYLKLMETPIYRDDGTYFEVVRGYPRAHYYHKRSYFSLERFTSYGVEDGVETAQVYQKGRNIASTTIGLNGISDGTDPVQATQVSNVDIIKSDNVIYH
jgi:hypothetical protein